MKWKIECLEDRGIVQAKTSGQMGWNDKIRLSKEMLAAGREKSVNKFLVDEKETVFGLSVLEIDNLPATLKEIGFGLKDKIAILVNPDSQNSGLLRFLQNVAILNSLQIRVFADPEEATDWLKAKSKL